MMKYIDHDKGTHFVYNQIVALVAYLALIVLNIPNPVLVAIAFGLAVGLSVELYQYKTKTGVPDVMDWVWGGLGVIIPFVPILAQGFLV